VLLCVVNLCDWELQVSLTLPRSGTRSKLQLCSLLSDQRSWCFRTSIFLSALLHSLSCLSCLLLFPYSSGLPHLTAVRCPSTPLWVNWSFRTLPCSIPCREATFTSLRVATPRGTTKSPHKQTSEAAPHKRMWEEIRPSLACSCCSMDRSLSFRFRTFRSCLTAFHYSSRY